MAGFDPDLIVQVSYRGELLYSGPAYWSWDDDDDTKIRISLEVDKPEEIT